MRSARRLLWHWVSRGSRFDDLYELCQGAGVIQFPMRMARDPIGARVLYDLKENGTRLILYLRQWCHGPIETPYKDSFQQEAIDFVGGRWGGPADWVSSAGHPYHWYDHTQIKPAEVVDWVVPHLNRVQYDGVMLDFFTNTVGPEFLEWQLEVVRLLQSRIVKEIWANGTPAFENKLAIALTKGGFAERMGERFRLSPMDLPHTRKNIVYDAYRAEGRFEEALQLASITNGYACPGRITNNYEPGTYTNEVLNWFNPNEPPIPTEEP